MWTWIWTQGQSWTSAFVTSQPIHFLFPPNKKLSQSENVTLSLNIILNDALFISKFNGLNHLYS